MRVVPALFALVLLTACSPAPPKEAASSPESSAASEIARASFEIAPEPMSSAVQIDGTCLSEIGKAASDRLVERCIMVSPATHPPCNAANSCQMIQGEIDRACAMYAPGETKPKECTA